MNSKEYTLPNGKKAVFEYDVCGIGKVTLECMDELMAMIADRPQEWIPCSERLPREEEQDDELGVLVNLGNGYSGLQYDWYHGDHWYDWDGYVLAWMPLPKPWKGAENDWEDG